MPARSESLQATLNALPHQPGIYLFKDEAARILYVGKATSLYHRVRSYFGDPSDLSLKNQALVPKIADIEFIVVANEVEALILENEYIKRHQPKYNVRLRDDKNYPYIKVSLTEDFPRVYRVRSFRHDGNRYFGPYTNSGAVDATLDLLNKLFPFRTCRYDAAPWAPPRGQEDAPPAGWKQKLLPRPCTQYFIHRCNAPCVAHTSRAQYDEVIRQVILFLEGKHDEVLAELRHQMEAAAEQLEFERASVLRDRVQAVERVLEKQKIINTTGGGDQDVVALAAADDETCAQIFFFRNGRLAGREYFILQGTRDTAPADVMGSFLQQFYDQASSIPGELVLAVEPEDAATLQAWLRARRGGAISLVAPKRGDKLRLVEMVAQNAREVLEQQRIKWLSDSQKTALALSEAVEDIWGQINAAAQLVPGLLDYGAYGEAFAVGQRAVALARTLEITPFLVLILVEWGNVCRAMLASDAAKIAHSEALTRCEGSMPPHYAGWVAGELCADCVVEGQWQQAYAYALKAAAARDPTILFGGVARWYEIAALLWGGSADQAREEVRRFGKGMNNNGRAAVYYLRSRAVLAQFEGEIDAAIVHLQGATRVAEEVGLPGELWLLCVELGELYQKQGDESQADRTFAHAAEILYSLADTMEDHQQRTSFLSAPVVKRVLEHVRFLE